MPYAIPESRTLMAAAVPDHHHRPDPQTELSPGHRGEGPTEVGPAVGGRPAVAGEGLPAFRTRRRGAEGPGGGAPEDVRRGLRAHRFTARRPSKTLPAKAAAEAAPSIMKIMEAQARTVASLVESERLNMGDPLAVRDGRPDGADVSLGRRRRPWPASPTPSTGGRRPPSSASGSSRAGWAVPRGWDEPITALTYSDWQAAEAALTALTRERRAFLGKKAQAKAEELSALYVAALEAEASSGAAG